MTSAPRLPRVAVGPTDVAGCAWALQAGLDAIGARCDVVLWSRPSTGFPAGRVLGRAGRARFGLGAPARTHVFHYQYGSTWLPLFADAYAARALRRTVVAQYYGDDCRVHSIASRHFPARAPVVDPKREEAVRARVRRLARIAHAAIVSDLELATYLTPFYRRIYVTALPLHPTERPRSARKPPDGRRVVLHAPTDPVAKGSAAIAEAVSSVAARVPVDYRLLTGVPYTEVEAALADADVVVDQLNSLTLGIFALEAMRAGAVVVGQFDRRVLAPYQSDFPAVEVTAATLEPVLETLLRDDRRRAEIAERAAAYVARTHDPATVATTLVAVYEHARTAGPGIFEATPAGIRELDLRAHVGTDLGEEASGRRPRSRGRSWA